jgi:hypothetical protein
MGVDNREERERLYSQARVELGASGRVAGGGKLTASA